MLSDTHCHLNLRHFNADGEQTVARAKAAGVTWLLVPGADLASSRRAVQLAGLYPEVVAAVGVHPNDTQDFGPAALKELRELAQNPKVVAIGEIGLDLHWKTVPLAEQQRAFVAQLELAAALHKPVIVHDREAHAEVLAVLQANRPPAGGVFHAFSGDRAIAEKVLAADFYLGVDGPLTYKNSAQLQAAFSSVPLDRILLETDAPYLTPHPHRGQRNEPAYVRYVAEKLAELRGLSVAQIAQATTDNARRLFGRSEDSNLKVI